MRILHLIHQYLPEFSGGTELYTHWLTKELSTRGHSLAIYHRSNRNGKGVEIESEHNIAKWSVWNGNFEPRDRFRATFGDAHMSGSFERAVDEIRPQIVHVEHALGLPASFAATLASRSIPYVITTWDFWWTCANAQLLTNYSREVCDGPRAYLNCARCALARSGLPQFYLALPPLALPLAWRNRRLAAVLEGASKLIAPARFVRDWYVSHGLPAEKFIVRTPGLDAPDIKRKETWGADRPLRVGYVGGISWQKGVHVLVEAHSKLNSATELLIAGDLAFDPAYTAQLRELAGNHVQFLGRLDRDEVWRLLSRVDVVVVPSLWYETHCFVVSEAYAAGVPVIASDLGVLSERVDNEVNGMLVSPGDVAAMRDALVRLQNESGLLLELTANVLPMPGFDQHVSDIEKVYQQVVYSED